jgi:glycosyltransferase involved in cell wall biosynthesis
MKAVVLISDRAYPALSGSKVRNLFLWRELRAQGVELRLLGMDLSPKGDSTPLVPGMEAEAFRHRRQILPLRAWNAALYSYHQWPYCKELAERVDELVGSWQPDLVHAEELRMAAYLPALRGKNSRARQTATFHNVESDLILRTGSTALSVAKPLVENLHRRTLAGFEKRVIDSLDRCLAYSDVDLESYRRKYGLGNWRSTRGGASVNEADCAPEITEPSALIAGSLGYAPNVEGIEWFLEKVKPQLDKNIRLTVAGSNASPALRKKITEAGIAFIDRPPEMAPLYASHALSLVPLLSGSGTRGRILESLGCARAVVTTTIGAEGLELAEGEGLVRADDSKRYAETVNQLMKNRDERARIARSGFERVRERYAWKAVASDLKKIWEELL